MSVDWMRALAESFAVHFPKFAHEPYFEDCFSRRVKERHAQEALNVTQMVLRERPELWNGGQRGFYKGRLSPANLKIAYVLLSRPGRMHGIVVGAARDFLHQLARDGFGEAVEAFGDKHESVRTADNVAAVIIIIKPRLLAEDREAVYRDAVLGHAVGGFFARW